MMLRNLWGKLRKRNKGDYRQFQFSTAFAVMLISSFLMLVCSPLIQGALPEGGDSEKQIWMSFGVSAIGCVVFVLYVTKLFLRYKSREIGIFLALGAEKHTLKRSLAGELAQMTAVCSAIGILLGAVIAFTTGNIIEVLIADVYDGNFTFTASGLLLSVCYALVLFLFIQFQAGRAMKRTNVMEVINEQRRQEPMKKSAEILQQPDRLRHDEIPGSLRGQEHAGHHAPPVRRAVCRILSANDAVRLFIRAGL